MKKTAVVILAVVALAATGCKKKEEAPQGVAPQGGMPAQQMPATAPGGDPHAGLKPVEIPAVDEKGQKLWLAVMETKVKVGDSVEFPDSPPMVNFQSKSLKRTFEKIYFAPGVRIAN